MAAGRICTLIPQVGQVAAASFYNYFSFYFCLNGANGFTINDGFLIVAAPLGGKQPFFMFAH
jgi:hypothetical protein